MSLFVALVVQVVWEVVRAVLEQTAVSPRDPHLAALGFGLTIATGVVAASAAVDMGRRLTGTRRVGAWVAAGAYVLIVACNALREGLLYRAGDNASAVDWIVAMYRYGWRGLDVLAVIGFAIAAGRRGLWLAPPAIGCAVIGMRPELVHDVAGRTGAIFFLTARIALVLLMAAATERHTPTPEPAREKAQRGLRRSEIASWIFAVASVTWVFPGFSSSSRLTAMVTTGIHLAGGGILAVGAWTLAQANVRDVVRWPLYLTVTCILWDLARLVRSWFLTFTRYWNRWDEAHFSIPHWSTVVWAVVASACTAAVLVVLARRSRSRESLVAAVLYGASVVVLYAVRFSVPEIHALMAACYVATNVLAARAYRAASTSLDMGLARARAL